MIYRKLNFTVLNMAAIKLSSRLIEVWYLKFLTYSLISVEQALRKLIANYVLADGGRPSETFCVVIR